MHRTVLQTTPLTRKGGGHRPYHADTTQGHCLHHGAWKTAVQGQQRLSKLQHHITGTTQTTLYAHWQAQHSGPGRVVPAAEWPASLCW